MKQVLATRAVGAGHWVGDGFPVHTIFSYHDQGEALSPFLLLDHAGPKDFPPTEAELGVDWHPHRGFETVTVVYAGEVEHGDSAGNAGRIGPGDVQWMTAGAGVLHKEMHGRDYARRGGAFEMLQLWVNLPTRHKMTAPRYQALLDADIPAVVLPGGAGTVRVIAGTFGAAPDTVATGPARTVTPINLLDVRLAAGGRLRLPLAAGTTAALYVLKGGIQVNGREQAAATDLVLLDREGADAEITATGAATLLVMNGEPINEPISGYGPFVMNTPAEIQQALADFRSGRLATLPAELA
ncbi:MAG: pirin family protein [Gammaproteobacteria bacterium]